MPVLNPQIRTDLSNAGITNPTFVNGAPPTVNGMAMRQGAGRAQRDVVAQAADSIAAMGGTTSLAFPHDEPKYWMSLSLSAYARGNINAVTTNNTAAIRLPIPKPLEDAQKIDYEQFEFGPLWGNVIRGATGLTNINAETGATPEQAQDNRTATVESMRALALSGSDTAAASYNAFYGMAVNKFFTILLKGPTYKQYMFEWVLQPRTAAESTTIRDIIRVLRMAAAPDLEGGGGAFWSFPMIVTPTFVPQGNGIETYMYRFKPAVMTDVAVSYAPFGTPGFYRGTGAPESVKLAIKFLELEYWLARDF